MIFRILLALSQTLWSRAPRRRTMGAARKINDGARSVVDRSRQDTKPPNWSLLPDLGDRLVPGTRTWYSSDTATEINFGTMSCTCSQWLEDKRHLVPEQYLGRCCDHMVRAVLHEITAGGVVVEPWLLCILESCAREYPPPPRFEHRIFSNGVEPFLALYDIRRGYVQLYSKSRSVQWGYDSSQNRWAHGAGPQHPLVIKKELRPWIKELDLRYGLT